MKRLVVLLILLFCTSCYYKEGVAFFSSNYYLFNKTGRTLEVYMGGEFWDFAKDQRSVWLYTKSSSAYEDVLMENVMINYPNAFVDISIYDVTDGERVFLKTWTFADRDKEGRQLYNLSDCDLIIHHDIGYPRTPVTLGYVFNVYPEDIGLK